MHSEVSQERKPNRWLPCISCVRRKDGKQYSGWGQRKHVISVAFNMVQRIVIKVLIIASDRIQRCEAREDWHCRLAQDCEYLREVFFCGRSRLNGTDTAGEDKYFGVIS